MPPNPAPRRWWRRLPVRLSVRSLMTVVLLLGGGLGWTVHRVRVQRDAVAAIRAAGGVVHYGWEWSDDHATSAGATERWPRWLIDALGPDFLETTVAVEMYRGRGNGADDALMTQVGRLDRLESLNLNGSAQVTDAGLAPLAGLTSLKHLNLDSTGATGAGLKHLAGLTRLIRLTLPKNPIADADLAHLKGMTDLKMLRCGRTMPGITDAGLAHLEGLINLQVLEFSSPHITSRGLAALRRMDRLTSLTLMACRITDLAPIRHLGGLSSLDLFYNPITDAGLAPVARFPGLTSLNLPNTPITDAGLDSLRDLKQLTHLDLANTRITDAGLARLGGFKPWTQVNVSGTAVTAEGVAAALRTHPQAAIIRINP